MEITKTESFARDFCLWIAKTSPRIVGDAANQMSWQWKSFSGTKYPDGVFVLAIYALFVLALGFGVVAVRAYMRRMR